MIPRRGDSRGTTLAYILRANCFCSLTRTCSSNRMIELDKQNPIRRRRSVTAIDSIRWAAYATAGTASALTFAGSAEAGEFYSGVINRHFQGTPSPPGVPGIPDTQKFLLEGGAFFSLGHAFLRSAGTAAGFAGFIIGGAAVASFAGVAKGSYRYVAKLNASAFVSLQNFVKNVQTSAGAPFPATLAQDGGYGGSQWLAPGTGFIGFKFSDGSGGIDYGWARITMDGSSKNTFTLVDYFFGEGPVRAGSIPETGSSLGLLALGCGGLLAWRRKQAKASA